MKKERGLLNKPTLLVVDDERFYYELYTYTLSEQFDLHYAESGKQCLLTAIELRPDIIILDVCMPELDGLDTCRLLKNTPETTAIPVVMISGLDSQQVKEQCLAAGCQLFFAKPLTFDDLGSQLRKLI